MERHFRNKDSPILRGWTSTDIIFSFPGAKVISEYILEQILGTKLLPLATQMHIMYSGSPLNRGPHKSENDSGI